MAYASARPVVSAASRLPLGLSPALALGVAACAAIAAAATLAGRFVPLVGAPVIAIVLGVALRAWRPLPRALVPGVAFSGKTVLQAAIVVSGFGLSFATVVRTGIATLPVTLATIAAALLLAPLLGRLLRVSGVLQTLIGVGTAICGASAIAAVSSVLEPDEDQLTLAIATIFLYNIAAVLLFPPLGHLLAMSQAAFGVWAGTAINDTSSVVAAAYAYGDAAGAQATIVKLARATFILPIVGILAILRARAASARGIAVPWKAIVPWFIVWFVCAALANTAGAVPADWHAGITAVSAFLIATALAAIGLQTNVAKLARAGARPLALGFGLWLAVAATSLLVQRLTGT